MNKKLIKIFLVLVFFCIYLNAQSINSYKYKFQNDPNTDIINVYKNNKLVNSYKIEGSLKFCDEKNDDCQSKGIVFKKIPTTNKIYMLVNGTNKKDETTLFIYDLSSKQNNPIKAYVSKYYIEYYSFKEGLSVKYDEDCELSHPCTRNDVFISSSRNMLKKEIVLENNMYKKLSFKNQIFEINVKNNMLIISDKNKKQILLEVYANGAETHSKIVWIGYLDDDKKLDLIIDNVSDYNQIMNLRSFKSSKSKENKLFVEDELNFVIGS